MKTRKLAQFEVAPVGLGCMSMSHAYGVPNFESATQTLHHALDIGYNFLDTAALYGFGENEKLIGETLKTRRHEYVMASKCGLIRGDDGKRSIDARPDVIRRTCETSLKNLQTDVIDLYYLHRVDPKVPLEDQVGTMAQLVEEGKIKSIGLSEVNANTLRKAHSIHPIAALQSEYSLWTRNPEGAVLTTCKELNITFVAFSPLGRGFLTGNLTDTDALVANDLRRSMPRFQGENFTRNKNLLDTILSLADEKQCTPAQLALAWLLAKESELITIPGTQVAQHAQQNFLALDVHLTEHEIDYLDNAFAPNKVFGERYNAATLAEMET